MAKWTSARLGRVNPRASRSRSPAYRQVHFYTSSSPVQAVAPPPPWRKRAVERGTVQLAVRAQGKTPTASPAPSFQEALSGSSSLGVRDTYSAVLRETDKSDFSRTTASIAYSPTGRIEENRWCRCDVQSLDGTSCWKGRPSVSGARRPSGLSGTATFFYTHRLAILGTVTCFFGGGGPGGALRRRGAQDSATAAQLVGISRGRAKGIVDVGPCWSPVYHVPRLTSTSQSARSA